MPVTIEHRGDEQRADREAHVPADEEHAHRLLAVAGGDPGGPGRLRVERGYPDPGQRDRQPRQQVTGGQPGQAARRRRW